MTMEPLRALVTAHFQQVMHKNRLQAILPRGPRGPKGPQTSNMQRFLRNFDDLEITPRTSPAASDESLQDQERIQRVRSAFPDSPEEFDGFRPMRIAMIQTAAGLKPPSGGFRGNYATLLALQKHGHKTMQFCWAYRKDVQNAIAELKAKEMFNDETFETGRVKMVNGQLEDVDVNFCKFTNTHGIYCVALNAETMIETFPNQDQQVDAKIMIETGELPARAAPYVNWIRQHLMDFQPTHVIFNDALANIITAQMPQSFKDGVSRVEVVHTLEQLPTGPYAGGVSGGAKCPAEIKLFKELDGIVTVSKAVQKYAKEHCDLETEMIPNHAWSYKDKDTSDWPRYRANFAKQNVVMINPARVKGYEIFLGMARENKQRSVENSWDALLDRPVYNFVAYTSWGSKPDMIRDLTAAGVKIFEPVIDMEPVYDNMSVLIVPSLWQEAWGIVATEAQLRGIPVIASNVGGLPEAKRYVGPLIDVNKIDGKSRDEEGNYIIPAQDSRPWMKELDALLTDKDRYEAVSHMGFYTTRQWVRAFDVRGMEKYLLSVMKR